VLPVVCEGKTLDVTTLALDQVTLDLPTDHVTLNATWMHLQDFPLANPTYKTPGRIDVILGAELFTVMAGGTDQENLLLQGRQ